MSDFTPRFSGERVDPKRCKAGVWDGYRHHQCSKRPSCDGYCGTHHPDARKKRDEARRALWREQDAANDLRRSVEAAERRVVQAALKADEAGHQWNDRGMAETVGVLRGLLEKAGR